MWGRPYAEDEAPTTKPAPGVFRPGAGRCRTAVRTRGPARTRRARGAGTGRQFRVTPYALSASVTGWKNVVPPELQLPLPPEVRPTALLPE